MITTLSVNNTQIKCLKLTMHIILICFPPCSKHFGGGLYHWNIVNCVLQNFSVCKFSVTMLSPLGYQFAGILSVSLKGCGNTCNSL